jgi:hypothetical protein
MTAPSFRIISNVTLIKCVSEAENFNRNEYQESSWGLKDSRHVRLTTLPPSVS